MERVFRVVHPRALPALPLRLRRGLGERTPASSAFPVSTIRIARGRHRHIPPHALRLARRIGDRRRGRERGEQRVVVCLRLVLIGRGGGRAEGGLDIGEALLGGCEGRRGWGSAAFPRGAGELDAVPLGGAGTGGDGEAGLGGGRRGLREVVFPF